MSTANLATIDRFYEAFSRSDGEAMEACYADDVTFSDPVFPDLEGREVGAMWRMLTSQATDLEVELVERDADEAEGSARWLADYTFSRTGRRVHNDVYAGFTFNDEGLISAHVDEFDFHRWARQALGLPGLLLGWTPIVRNGVRKQAGESLDRFLEEDRARS